MARIITENGITFLRDEWSADDVRNVIECNGIEAAERPNRSRHSQLTT